MNRRTVLATIGTATFIPALAGCSEAEADEGDDDYVNPNDDDTGDDESDEAADAEHDEPKEPEEPDPEDVENRDEGEDVLEFGDLHILEYDQEIEEREWGDDQMSFVGIVENTGEEKYDSVTISVRVYDHDGHQLDRYLDITSDLSGNQTWRFDVTILEDADEIGDYDIAVTGRRW
jgi:hypothetical protein